MVLIRLVLLSFIFIMAGYTCAAQESLDQYIAHLDTAYRKQPLDAIPLLQTFANDLDLDDVNKSNYYYALSKYSYRGSTFDDSKDWARNGLVLELQNNISENRAGFYNLLGASQMAVGLPDSAAYYFAQAAEQLEKEGDFGKAAFVYNNISTIYFETERFDKALPYLKAAEKYMRSEKIEDFLITILGNISYCYINLDSVEQADRYADEAIEKGLKMKLLNGPIYGYMTKSDIAKKNNDTQQAITYSKKAYDLAVADEDKYRQGLVAMHLCQMYNPSDTKEAKAYGEIATKLIGTYEPRFLPAAYKLLSEAYIANGSYKKAALSQQTYIRLQDSINTAQAFANSEELITKYETAQKEATIYAQQAEIAEEKLKSNTLLYGLGILSLISIGGLAFFSQQKRLQKQRITNLQNQQRIAISKGLIEGEERERRRLAKELHDGIANDIAALKMKMEMDLYQQTSQESSFQFATEQLEKIHKDTRAISHDLLPVTLTDQSLESSIKSLFEEKLPRDRQGLLTIGSLEQMPKNTEVYVYRLIQEMLLNAAKHADATCIDLGIKSQDQRLHIVVSDNGKGMTEQQLSEGLQFLKDRVKDLQGELKIFSEATKGTKIIVKVPYHV